MVYDDYIRMGEVYANRSLRDELLTLLNRSKSRLALAKEADDFEGRIFFRARIDQLDRLIKVLDPDHKDTKEE